MESKAPLLVKRNNGNLTTEKWEEEKELATQEGVSIFDQSIAFTLHREG